MSVGAERMQRTGLGIPLVVEKEKNMNKRVLAAFAATAVLGVAVAGATPQTSFDKGETQLDLGAWNVKTTVGYEDNAGNDYKFDGKWNFTGGVTHALSDKLAVQYEYHGLNSGRLQGGTAELDGDQHELNVLYSLNKNLAVYAGWTQLKIDGQGFEAKNSVAQIGLVGKAPITDKLDAYGRVAIGSKSTTIWEAGLGYSITDDLDVNAGYRFVNTDTPNVNDSSTTFKGFTAGLSYRFGGSEKVVEEPVYVAPMPVRPAPQPAPVHVNNDYYLQSIYFDVDQDMPRADQGANLEAFYKATQEYSTNRFKVVGNTDSDANADYNLDLSKRRVANVAQYAIDRGVSADRLVGMYNGEAKPAASNDTATGKAENRRVDIYVNR